jgi:hypothetical protein
VAFRSHCRPTVTQCAKTFFSQRFVPPLGSAFLNVIASHAKVLPGLMVIAAADADSTRFQGLTADER